MCNAGSRPNPRRRKFTLSETEERYGPAPSRSLIQKSYPFLRGRLPSYLKSIIRTSRPREMFDQTPIHKFAEIKRSLFRFFMKPKSIEVHDSNYHIACVREVCSERLLLLTSSKVPGLLWPAPISDVNVA